MQIDRLASGGSAKAPLEVGAVRCGGFRVSFEEDEPIVRLVPGDRRLAEGLQAAVLQGLAQAPVLLAAALHLKPARRPYERVEVVLAAGALVQGEAVCAGEGRIRLSLGEECRLQDAVRIATHEALHLLLAATLHGGEKWNDPDLAFADWIVRGIEGGQSAGVPRFQPPLPALIERLPTSRLEVQRQLGSLSAAPGTARRYFGDPLFEELQRISAQGPDSAHDSAEQRQLWLVEAALGAHYLEAAGNVHLEETDALRPIVLDDWLLDYERYARAVANTPSGAGNFWPLSDVGWSRDPLTRLSVAAQALQRDDHSFFAGERFASAGEPVVWKSQGRVRLPFLPARARARPLPLHTFRAMLRELPSDGGPAALALIEDAARGPAAKFEARVLWPRILARLLSLGSAADLDAPEDLAVPLVQLVHDDDAAASDTATTEWREAAACLRVLFGEHAAWLPAVLPARHADTLGESARSPSSTLLVHAVPLGAADASRLASSRQLAAHRPIRGALFRDHLSGGRAFELLPDLEPPVDPRYREETWVTRGAPSALARPLPTTLAELVKSVDEATASGTLTTPLTHLLSLTAVGLEECHFAFS